MGVVEWVCTVTHSEKADPRKFDEKKRVLS